MNSRQEMPLFIYESTFGSRGQQPYRMEPVETDFSAGGLLETLNAALGDKHDVVYKHADGSVLSLGIMRGLFGFTVPYKYCLVFEIPRRKVYTVFYVTADGEVCWIAGPKKYDFTTVWTRLLEGLCREMH